MLGLFRETEPIGYLLVFINIPVVYMGLPWWFNSKNPSASAGDVGSIPGPGRSPGEGNGNPLRYSCLGNPVDRGAWQATGHRVAKELDTT